MAKAKTTKSIKAPKAEKVTKVAAAPAAPSDVAEEPAAPTPLFSVALATPGEDIPDGARRFGCPDCGAKHDVARTDGASGQGGTWTLTDFVCIAGCGYKAATQPVG